MAVLDSELQSSGVNVMPFVSINELSGKYLYVRKAPLSALGLDVSTVLGCKWQDFAAGSDVDLEQAGIQQALYTGNNVHLPPITKTLFGTTLTLKTQITPLLGAAGTQLIMRESYTVPSDDNLPANLGEEASDMAQYLGRQLETMILMARRDDMDMLSYLLEMAALHIKSTR